MFGAVVSAVQPLSPADDAGFIQGCVIHSVNGHMLRDIIDWRWYSDENSMVLEYTDTEGDSGTVELWRNEGENWGFEFEELIFDEVKQCRNNCMFCFMQQLPKDARSSLRFRDDDYRLSFLQGNFATFTNISQEEEARIIEQHISPLRYSLHIVDDEVRRRIIGPHAHRGLEVAEHLLAHGIELHAQIVLMPGINDGEELVHTLTWAYARPSIKSVGIVPLGFTKYQSTFVHSFNHAADAQAVLECIRPFQERALKQRGNAWVHAADEFYCNAYPNDFLQQLPPRFYYGEFELFDDGIGIVRSYVDDFLLCTQGQELAAQTCGRAGMHVYMIAGCAQKPFFTPLVNQSVLKEYFEPLYVENHYFGGNVDVTGLLCACDVVPAIQRAFQQSSGNTLACVPAVMFNADGLTLDGKTIEDIRYETGSNVYVVSCQASDYLQEIIDIIQSTEGVLHG